MYKRIITNLSARQNVQVLLGIQIVFITVIVLSPDIISWKEKPRLLLSPSSSGPFRDCFQVRQAGHSTSGMYLLKAEGSDRLIQAWCEHKLDNGGWTVFQRRKDGSVNFFRNWENYKVRAHIT